MLGKALPLALLLYGCGAGPVKQFKVGDHLFNIPERNVMEDDVFFLPKDHAEGFYVVLDPDAPQAEHVSIIVRTVAATCSFDNPPVVDQLPQACAVARGEAPQPTPGRLTKAPRFPGDMTQYDYKGEDGHVAVSCSGEPGRPGSCSAAYAWRGLIWDASFDETQVPRLDTIRAEIARKLDEWSGQKA